MIAVSKVIILNQRDQRCTGIFRGGVCRKLLCRKINGKISKDTISDELIEIKCHRCGAINVF